jgi:SAM-dependent methyltransferase
VRVTDPHDRAAPSSWLVAHRHLLPALGRALDVACGRGRNTLWLAREGFDVTAIDRNPEAVAALNDRARAAGLAVAGVVVDLEAGDADLGRDAYDVIVVVHYLHRALFPALLAALMPGGVLVYETFTTAQAARGRPTNPAFLLEPGELRRHVEGLEILDARQGDFDGRMVSSVVAVRPAARDASRAPWIPRRP